LSMAVLEALPSRTDCAVVLSPFPRFSHIPRSQCTASGRSPINWRTSRITRLSHLWSCQATARRQAFRDVGATLALPPPLRARNRPANFPCQLALGPLGGDRCWMRAGEFGDERVKQAHNWALFGCSSCSAATLLRGPFMLSSVFGVTRNVWFFFSGSFALLVIRVRGAWPDQGSVGSQAGAAHLPAPPYYPPPST
jgi:hypothetical protein